MADLRKPAAQPEFSFCESVYASGRSSWHIRQLSIRGRKLGGGIDSGSLCTHVRSGWGWDLNVEITEHHLEHACRPCVEEYRLRIRDLISRLA